MVKSSETEFEQVQESSENEAKVERVIEKALPNTSSEQIIRLADKEKGGKEGSDEDIDHGEECCFFFSQSINVINCIAYLFRSVVHILCKTPLL